MRSYFARISLVFRSYSARIPLVPLLVFCGGGFRGVKAPSPPCRKGLTAPVRPLFKRIGVFHFAFASGVPAAIECRHVRAPRLFDGRFPIAVAGIGVALCAAAAWGQPLGLDGLAKLTPGRTKAENALWIENPLTAQFKTSKRVVVADLKGPAVITMIHFAYGQSQISHAEQAAQSRPAAAHLLGRRGFAERGLSAGGFLLRPGGHARRGQHGAGERAPRFQRLLPDAVPQVRPRSSWSMTGRWRRATSCGSSCRATRMCAIAR